MAWSPTPRVVPVTVLPNNTAVTLSFSLDPSTQLVTVLAGVLASGGTPLQNPTGTVVFYDGQYYLGSASVADGVASLSISLGDGDHSITAYYSGDDVFANSISDPLTVTLTTPLT